MTKKINETDSDLTNDSGIFIYPNRERTPCECGLVAVGILISRDVLKPYCTDCIQKAGKEAHAK